METKRCSVCGVEYPLTREHFTYRNKQKGTFHDECIECGRERRRRYDKAYRAKNREKERERHKLYREKHGDSVTKYREKRREYFAEKRKAFLQNHPGYFAEYFRERHKDPLKKLEDQVRQTIRSSFGRRGYKKRSKTELLTGMPSEELTNYLLKTFRDNYGREWDGIESVHIDHIVPLVTAKTENDVNRLCHYSNLQLLTAEDNLRKHTKEQSPSH